MTTRNRRTQPVRSAPGIALEQIERAAQILAAFTPAYLEALAASPVDQLERAAATPSSPPPRETDLMGMPEVSEKTGIPVNTLRSWRKQGRGPKAARLGGRVLYRRRDVDAWIDEQFAANS